MAETPGLGAMRSFWWGGLPEGLRRFPDWEWYNVIIFDPGSVHFAGGDAAGAPSPKICSCCENHLTSISSEPENG